MHLLMARVRLKLLLTKSLIDVLMKIPTFGFVTLFSHKTISFKMINQLETNWIELFRSRACNFRKNSTVAPSQSSTGKKSLCEEEFQRLVFFPCDKQLFVSYLIERSIAGIFLFPWTPSLESASSDVLRRVSAFSSSLTHFSHKRLCEFSAFTTGSVFRESSSAQGGGIYHASIKC